MKNRVKNRLKDSVRENQSGKQGRSFIVSLVSSWLARRLMLLAQGSQQSVREDDVGRQSQRQTVIGTQLLGHRVSR